MTFTLNGVTYETYEKAYRPRRCYEYDDDTKSIIGRFYFIITGEYADGTKAWTKCDKDGEPISSAIYTVGRKAGHMIAFLEAID